MLGSVMSNASLKVINSQGGPFQKLANPLWTPFRNNLKNKCYYSDHIIGVQKC